MKKSILINGSAFQYEAVDLQYGNLPTLTFEQAQAVFMKAKELLDEKNIRFVLIYGTLLGAIREHSFISHDYDVDIYVEQVDELIAAVPEFYEKGFKLCRYEENRLLSFMWKGVYIDIYLKKLPPFPWSIYCDMIGNGVIPKKLTKETIEYDFLGTKCLIPKRYEELLTFFYGKNWHTPVKGGKWNYTVWSFGIARKCREFIVKHRK